MPIGLHLTVLLCRLAFLIVREQPQKAVPGPNEYHHSHSPPPCARAESETVDERNPAPPKKAPNDEPPAEANERDGFNHSFNVVRADLATIHSMR